MAVLAVNRLWSGRGGMDTFTRQRTYREEWEVLTDDPEDTESDVGGAPAIALGLPVLGAPHPTDARAVCVEVDAAQSDESPFRWNVYIKYDTSPPLPNALDPDGASQSPADIPENPLLRPATWEVSFETSQEPAVKWRRVNALGNLEADFVAVRNSANLPFDPPLMVDVSRPVFRITKNVASVSVSYLMSCENAINDATWRGLPKWTAKIRSTRASNKYENGFSYVELSLEIAIRQETWLPEVLDAGLYEMLQVSSITPVTWVRIKDPYNHEASEPQPLDGNGRRLAPNAAPVYLRGLPKQYRLASFPTLLGV